MFPIRDTLPRRHTPVATIAIIGVNAAVFFIELSLPPETLEAVFYVFGLVPRRYSQPEWARWVGLPANDVWPFVTHMFLHGGWMHVIGNMWTLWIFGDNVEDRMGPWRFLAFYLVCGWAAAGLHWGINPASTVPTVGASGAIAGVLGAYFFLYPRAKVIAMFPILFFPFFFELPAVVYLGLWALLQLVSGTMSLARPEDVGGVAWWAHAGGFAAGLLLHRLFLVRRRPFERDESGPGVAWVRWRESA